MGGELRKLVETFGVETKAKLAGAGEPEEALRVPLEHLVVAVGALLGKRTELDGETHLSEISSRPDFAVRVNGAVVGYLEVKKAGLSLDPSTFRGHNKGQWDRLQDLPNLIYTNGKDWRLYHGDDDAPLTATLSGGELHEAGAALAPDSDFEQLMTDFLSWRPTPIRTVAKLVRVVAPVTRMVRTKVEEQLLLEHLAVRRGEPEHKQQFLGLASDWRKLLFPEASDTVFADGYAQTVTFALLLARTEGIDLDSVHLFEVGQKLGTEHSLMGRALQLLTQDVKGDFVPTIELLTRVIGAVEWDAVRKNRDTYLHLYERFLAEYDPELRKSTGSYYSPHEIVDEMVRLTEEVLVDHLNKKTGFQDPSVTTVDPAMGTGTFLHSIIEHVARKAGARDGEGAIAGSVTELASRLIGLELQLGSFAVAELRTTDLLKSYDATPPPGGMRMFVADTLSDPSASDTQLGSGLGAISESKREANRIKAKVPVTVVIGNPPYSDQAEGQGGWVESGSKATLNVKAARGTKLVPLDAFRAPGNGLHEFNLKNLYVYFWRWATWKVFESVPEDSSGVICFISTAGYLRGPAYRGMREYLRREADLGWVIDLTPEGQRPDVATRIFPGVQQPLAIGIFVRKPDHDNVNPAEILYRELHGRQSEKFAALADVNLRDGWQVVRTGFQEPFTSASAVWDASPALVDLLPWFSPGVTGNRGWPYAPSRAVLEERWATLRATNSVDFETLMKTTPDRKPNKIVGPLPGEDTYQESVSLLEDTSTLKTVRVAYRAFDRQHVVADARVLDRPRPALWATRQPGNIYVIEQHSQAVHDGPGLLFTSLIPDLHNFNNRGGRVVPFLHPDGTPNLAPALLDSLAKVFGRAVTAEEVLAYIAGVVSHPGYTTMFEEELTTPGVRVPVTAQVKLWDTAVSLGQQVLWLHSHGAEFTSDSRPANDVRAGWSIERQPLAVQKVGTMPVTIGFDDSRNEVFFLDANGEPDGAWGPVDRRVFDYTVGGMNVLGSWFKYRKQDPGGKKTSPLDDIHVTEWPLEWTLEFTDLLTVLTRLIDLEEQQEEVLLDVLNSDMQTMKDLNATGTLWPSTKDDRKPRMRVVSLANELDADWATNL